MKNTWIMYVIGGGLLYLWMTRNTEPVPAGQPVATNGALQPQGVQGGDEPIANSYDLQAFPMGTFVQR